MRLTERLLSASGRGSRVVVTVMESVAVDEGCDVVVGVGCGEVWAVETQRPSRKNEIHTGRDFMLGLRFGSGSIMRLFGSGSSGSFVLK
jgi:hypothetical protein